MLFHLWTLLANRRLAVQTAERVTINNDVVLMTLNEAARELGVHPATARRWAVSGRLRLYRVGPHAGLTTLADIETLKGERLAS